MQDECEEKKSALARENQTTWFNENENGNEEKYKSTSIPQNKIE